MEEDSVRCPETVEGAASSIVDALRLLLSSLGALLASNAGLKAAQDAAELRSLPALGKALKRLWFDTPISDWDTKEQAVWLCRVLAVTEGSRAGILSFYGAGLLFCDALAMFAEVSLAELDVPLDEAWIAQALAVQEVLRGRHWEQMQQWPADRRCGGGSDPLVSPDRLPKSLKRALDLEGVRLTKAQTAGLGIAFLMPGSMTIAMGGIGAAMLVKTARDLSSSSSSEAGDSRWQALQAEWLKHAHTLLRRKTCPVEVRFAVGSHDVQTIKVSLYSVKDALCAMPVGSLASLGGSSTGGESMARLQPGDQCALRPTGEADSFRLRVYKPAPVFDIVLNDGVEVRRGDRVAIFLSANGQEAKVFAAKAKSAGTGETVESEVRS